MSRRGSWHWVLTEDGEHATIEAMVSKSEEGMDNFRGASIDDTDSEYSDTDADSKHSDIIIEDDAFSDVDDNDTGDDDSSNGNDEFPLNRRNALWEERFKDLVEYQKKYFV